MRGSIVLMLFATLVVAQERGDVRVRVVGPTGMPLPGVGVGNGKVEGEGEVVGRTDENGVLVLRDLPYDGGVFLSVHDKRLPRRRYMAVSGPVPVRTQGGRVTGPELTIRAHSGIRWTLKFVDAETEKHLPGVAWTFEFVGMGEPRKTATRIVYERSFFRLHDVPAGFSADTREVRFWGVSRYAREIRCVIPVLRLTKVDLLLKRKDGSSAAGVWINHIEFGGRKVRVARFAGKQGVIRIGAIPFFRDEPIRVHGEVANEEEKNGKPRGLTGSGRLPRRHAPAVRVSVTVQPVEVEVTASGGNSTIGVAGARDPATGSARLRIRVLRWNGEPASGIGLNLVPPGKKDRVRAVTDGKGVAAIEDLSGGCRWKIHTSTPGFVQASHEVDLLENKLVSVTLQEPRPGTVRLTVVDERGDPVHFARVAIDKESWYDSFHQVEDGVERLDRFTNFDGTRRLECLPPGSMKVLAAYGSRLGATRCVVEPGKSIDVRVQLGKEADKD